jgi:hypothetical protein
MRFARSAKRHLAANVAQAGNIATDAIPQCISNTCLLVSRLWPLNGEASKKIDA